jgi:hypothetical protein
MQPPCATETKSPETVCAICLDPITQGAEATACAHMFHGSCLSTWLRTHDRCPECRLPAPLNFDRHAAGLDRTDGSTLPSAVPAACACARSRSSPLLSACRCTVLRCCVVWLVAVLLLGRMVPTLVVATVALTALAAASVSAAVVDAALEGYPTAVSFCAASAGVFGVLALFAHTALVPAPRV